MKTDKIEYTAHYLNHNDNDIYHCKILAYTKLDAIELFEELYPTRMLISLMPLKLKLNSDETIIQEN